MPDTLTAVWQFTKPQVGGSTNTWGGKLNTDLDSVDDLHARPRPINFDATSGAGAVNLANGLVQDITVTAPITVAISNVPANPPSGDSIWTRLFLRLKNAGTQITWPGSVTWLSGVTPVFDTAGLDLVSLGTTDNGTTWVGEHHNITDLKPVTVLAQAASIPVDLRLGDAFTLDLSGATAGTTDTISILNASPNRRHIRFYITPHGHAAGASPFVLAWPASVHWIPNITPIFETNNASKILVDMYSPDAGTTWYATTTALAGTTQRSQVAAGALNPTRGTPTTVSFNNPAVFDTPLQMFNFGLNPTRLTVPAGYSGAPIRVLAEASFNPGAGNTAGSAWVGIMKNGGAISSSGMNQAGLMIAPGHTVSGPNLPFDIQFEFYDPAPAPGDYYEMFVNNDSTVGGFVGEQMTAIQEGSA